MGAVLKVVSSGTFCWDLTSVQLLSKAAEKKAEPRAEISQPARMRSVPYACSSGSASASHTSTLLTMCWKPSCTNTAQQYSRTQGILTVSMNVIHMMLMLTVQLTMCLKAVMRKHGMA